MGQLDRANRALAPLELEVVKSGKRYNIMQDGEPTNSRPLNLEEAQAAVGALCIENAREYVEEACALLYAVTDRLLERGLPEDFAKEYLIEDIAGNMEKALTLITGENEFDYFPAGDKQGIHFGNGTFREITRELDNGQNAGD